MKTHFLSFLLLIGLLQLGYAQSDVQKKIQTELILAEKGAVIEVPSGNFHFDGTLSIDEKEGLILKGAGKDKTFLSFADQSNGAEGIRITNSQNITIEGLTIQDASGDAIKAMEVQGMTFRDVRTEWTGRPKASNGAYGLYPVTCENVLIEQCEAIGASDAGIYVGQSHNIIVRDSRAYHNVAGIEIENSTQAEVYNCEAYDNTGGILVFDLPDLPKKRGGNVRVYQNKVHHNNYKNFAPKGNIVGKVPPGTGIMILATKEVEVFENEIKDNRTVGLTFVSYYITEEKIKDEAYHPYPYSLYIHDNLFVKTKKRRPTWRNKLGFLLWMKFGRKVPDIIYDGITPDEALDADGNFKDAYRICIQNNGGATFANIDAEGGFKNIRRDISRYDCSRDALQKVILGK
jgi:parallel beta-helix repeat protein